MVPEGDEVGAGGYGQGDGVGLSWVVSGAVVVLAEASVSGVGDETGTDDDVSEDVDVGPVDVQICHQRWLAAPQLGN